MAEIAIKMENCTGDHAKHICTLVETNRLEAVIPLAEEPQYICVNCGRVANSSDNLCNPAHINSFGLM